jgi:hypothetical protein
MKKIIGFLLVAGLVLVVALPAMGKPQGAAKLKFSGQTMPAVDFSHDAHKGYVEDCKDCHHMGVGTGTCIDCHGKDNRSRSKKKAFHTSCKGCHKIKGVSKRKDCQFCHNG